MCLPKCTALSFTLMDWDLALQEHSWAISVELDQTTGLILQLTELLEIWHGTEKKICWVVRLTGESESAIIPVTQIREVGAGQEQMGMFFHYTWLETGVRDSRLKLRSTAPKSSILSYFLWFQMHNWWGKNIKHILNSSLKQASSAGILELFCFSPT